MTVDFDHHWGRAVFAQSAISQRPKFQRRGSDLGALSLSSCDEIAVGRNKA